MESVLPRCSLVGVLVPSGVRLADLREWAGNSPSDADTPDRELCRAQLAAHEGGSSAELVERVRAIIDRAPVFWRNGPWLACHGIFAFMACGRPDLAADLVATRLPRGSRIEFGISPIASRDVQVMRWRILDATLSVFEMNEKLFKGSYKVAMGMMMRWIPVAPLFARYGLEGRAGAGEIDVNIFDVANLPGLGFCSDRPGVFLLPDPFFIEMHGYEDLRRHYEVHPTPWRDRIPVAFWRGSTTGQPLDADLGWRSKPRVRLCEIGQQRPDLVDAAITRVCHIDDPDAEPWLRRNGLFAASVPETSFGNYKYQIDIDGVSNSWSGLFQKLLTGSPVLKVSSPVGFRQWYYDRLKPWVNFVTVADDMSDLFDKVQWLKKHDAVARAIGEKGQALACSLDYDGQMREACKIIDAALRIAAGRPEIELSFGAQRAANSHLRERWLEPEADSASTNGVESRGG
jgi:hypothetical protein